MTLRASAPTGEGDAAPGAEEAPIMPWDGHVNGFLTKGASNLRHEG